MKFLSPDYFLSVIGVSVVLSFEGDQIQVATDIHATWRPATLDRDYINSLK